VERLWSKVLSDTQNGRLADSGVNEKTILHLASRCALVLVPLPMASPTTPAENPMAKTKLRGLALLRTFLVTGKLYEHKTAGQRA
jgi:hypothetical protein